ncbi:putative spindle poison sensitivity protein [Phaeomoniella chlamydospora]|uniref:Putative spindle poison sensitivity protein n=1 Tax=Phaeomoniella chlamydospora TaxID=158046 RepID=A0A0G2DSP8_PHACM|nr:putative spindle poison sensitivity protein [Phaeomoniella chlamydospora]
MGGPPGHLNIGGRVNPSTYHPQDSALANSLLAQQQINGAPYSNYPYMMGDEYGDRLYDQMPAIDVGVGSNPTSKYGSPTEESRLPQSPVGHHLSALDAPLPASFDSNGISHIARYGPVAASVPSKFALDSPPASMPQRTGAPSDAIKALHDTAYGNMRNISSALGSSPPGLAEEDAVPRTLHSQRIFRTKPVSASLPRHGPMDEWDEGFVMEEDLLPPSLHEDVLTPQEKARRTSRSEHDLSTPKDMSGPRGIPSTSSSKVGSPIASSPSRFASLFAKQRQQKEAEGGASSGHVGSPLRESVLSQRPGASVSMGTRFASGDSSVSLSSPPRQSSMSTLSQQLRGMHLKRTESSESGNNLHPAIAARYSSGAGRFDRTVSSPGLSTTRIDEEAPDLVFSMEEEETSKKTGAAWTSKLP